jgi:catechol 2,3-dioxygenase-like lactoylglutathione lyase family enzyme
MIRLERLGHLALFVADLQRAKDFYVQMLGCHVLEEESAGHGRTAFLEIGDKGNTLDLVELAAGAAAADRAGAGADAAGAAPGRGLHHHAFETATREALRDAYFTLIDHGIEVPYLVDHGSSQSVYFRDPDGHMVEIYWTPPGGRKLWEQGRGDEHRPLSFER